MWCVWNSTTCSSSARRKRVAEQQVAREVERLRRVHLQERVERSPLGAGRVEIDERQPGVPLVEHDLLGDLAVSDEHRAQRLVPFDDVRTAARARTVERARTRSRARRCRSRLPIEMVEEEQLLLVGRERIARRSVPASTFAAGRSDASRRRVASRSAKALSTGCSKRARTESSSRSSRDLRHDARREQRMAAEVEEVVARGRRSPDAEHIAPDRATRCSVSVAGTRRPRASLRALEDGRRQRRASSFPFGVSGSRDEPDERRRNHEGGQLRAGAARGIAVGVELRVRAPARDTGDEPAVTRRVLAHHDRDSTRPGVLRRARPRSRRARSGSRGSSPGRRCVRGIDLAVATAPGAVAGPVEPAVAEWVLQEALSVSSGRFR